MGRDVQCFDEAQLATLSREPNKVVYKAVHDNVYDPWPAERVSRCVDRLVALTRAGVPPARVRAEHPELDEFARLYVQFFARLTDREFSADNAHVTTLKRLIGLKGMLERREVTSEEAQAGAADIAFRSLLERTRSAGGGN